MFMRAELSAEPIGIAQIIIIFRQFVQIIWIFK